MPLFSTVYLQWSFFSNDGASALSTSINRNIFFPSKLFTSTSLMKGSALACWTWKYLGTARLMPSIMWLICLWIKELRKKDVVRKVRWELGSFYTFLKWICRSSRKELGKGKYRKCWIWDLGLNCTRTQMAEASHILSGIFRELAFNWKCKRNKFFAGALEIVGRKASDMAQAIFWSCSLKQHLYFCAFVSKRPHQREPGAWATPLQYWYACGIRVLVMLSNVLTLAADLRACRMCSRCMLAIITAVWYLRVSVATNNWYALQLQRKRYSVGSCVAVTRISGNWVMEPKVYKRTNVVNNALTYLAISTVITMKSLAKKPALRI